MAKSIILTYILWLFGGGFGLHHFYLKRDIQGFLYLCFPGDEHEIFILTTNNKCGNYKLQIT
jgi:hypothetical protein